MKSEAIIKKLVRSLLKPIPDMPIWQWVEENIQMPPGSQFPGAFNTGLVPFTRGIYDAYQDPRIRFIVLAKSAQVGASTMLRNIAAWRIANKPREGLYVTSTEKVATGYSRQQFQPHLLRCKALNGIIMQDRSNWTTLEMIFRNGAKLGLVGSNSPAVLASRPVADLDADETDKWPEDNLKEAPSYDLALARTKTYERTRKIFVLSTPTVEGGVIWQEFLKGDQRYYHVPCWSCGRMQPLQFFYSEQNGGLWFPAEARNEDGIWDIDAVAAEARYVCKFCGHKHEEKRKRPMIDAGQWVSTNSKASSDRASFHINAMYSPFETWGGMATLWLQAQDGTGKLHDFWNNYLGLPWIRTATTVKVGDIKEVQQISPEYRLRQLPIEPRLLTMTVDVQQENFFWTIRAWLANKDSYLIDYGSAVSYEDLLEISQRKFVYADKQFGIYKIMIDSGYTAKRKSGVYDWCLRTGGRFFPSKGSGRNQGLLHTIRETRITHRKSTLLLVQYDDDAFKEELYRRRIKERTGSKWYLPRDLGHDYVEQLTAERLAEKKNTRGAFEFQWEAVGDNHLGDCEKMQLVFGDMVGSYLSRTPKNESIDTE